MTVMQCTAKLQNGGLPQGSGHIHYIAPIKMMHLAPTYLKSLARKSPTSFAFKPRPCFLSRPTPYNLPKSDEGTQAGMVM
jgi:hypothetical protein